MTIQNKPENITESKTENIKEIDINLYNKLLERRNKINEKQKLYRVHYADKSEEQKENIKEHSKKYYYNKIQTEEGKEQIRKRAREYYQNKIKADPDKYNKIKERNKEKYNRLNNTQTQNPKEFINLEIAAY